MADATMPPAGWYDDGRGERRYWDGTQWTEHTAPHAPPAEQEATLPYETVVLSGPRSAAASDYQDTVPFALAPAGATPPPDTPSPAPEPGGVNVLGVVSLVIAAVGFVFAFIPLVQVVALILLPIAFVLSIVALFLEGRKWPAITGLIVSVLGAIVGAVVFVIVTLGIIGQVVDSPAIQDEIRKQFEEQFGTPVPREEPGDPGAAPAEELSFGETTAWGDGVSMTVSGPEPFTPSDVAIGADQAENLVFTLTITNDSSENVQPVVLSRLESGDAEVTRIFDVAAEGGQVGIPPTTAIPPGDSITWREAWSVDDPDSLTMRTAPSFAYEDAIFTNAR